MKLQELLDDHSVTKVRKAKWANPKEHLVLPSVVTTASRGAVRGVWCRLYGYDGNAEGTYGYRNMLVFTVIGDGSETDWEEWKEPA